MTYVAISVGAILGANARYLLGGWISDRFGSGFPLGTLVINVTGSIGGAGTFDGIYLAGITAVILAVAW